MRSRLVSSLYSSVLFCPLDPFTLHSHFVCFCPNSMSTDPPLQGDTSPGEPGLVWLWFWLFHPLPGLMGNWQNWLSSWARWWNIPNQSQPNPDLPGDGSPCPCVDIQVVNTYVLFKNPFEAIFGRFFVWFIKSIELPPCSVEESVARRRHRDPDCHHCRRGGLWAVRFRHQQGEADHLLKFLVPSI